MDSLSERNRILENLDLIVAYNKNVRKELESKQGNLFSFVVPDGASARAPLALRSAPPASRRELLSWEKELLGLYVSAHPFEEMAKEFAGLLTPIPEALAKPDRSPVRVGGTALSVKRITTKKTGEPMLFVGIEDAAGAAEVLVFPSVLRENEAPWREGVNLIVTGKVSKRDGETKILADKGWPITPETAPVYKAHFRGEAPPPEAGTAGGVLIDIPPKLPPEARAAMKGLFSRFKGSARVTLRVPDPSAGAGRFQKIDTPYRIEPSPDAVRELEGLVGFGNVRLDTPEGMRYSSPSS
jgi:DNA polymerase-3 subunit alpha